MIKKLLVLILLLIPVTSFSQTKFDIPMSPEEQWVQETLSRIEYWANHLEKLSPKYDWGNFGPQGGDCSGQMYWIFHMAGAPFIRTTALQMWSGLWPGYNVNNWSDTDFPELVFFKWSSDRPFGHVGLVRTRSDYPEKLEFDEASSGANAFKRTVMKKGSTYDKHFAGIRIPDLSVGFTKGPRKYPQPRINAESGVKKLPTGAEKELRNKK